jgi:hypothetical protein
MKHGWEFEFDPCSSVLNPWLRIAWWTLITLVYYAYVRQMRKSLAVMTIEEEIKAVVHKQGWFCANVFDHDPPFLYSIGILETFQHPELKVFGLETKIAVELLTNIFLRIREGEVFTSDGISEIQFGDTIRRIAIRRVHPTQHQFYLGYAMGYCRHIGLSTDLEALQVFWTDKTGRFPFESNFATELQKLQPRLDLPRTLEEIEEFERQFE